MQLWAKPLTWGLTYEQLTKRYGYKIDIHNDKIRVNSLTIQNFPSDCGSLIITGANSATTENLSLVIDIASCCGFNKIFATVVGENKENAVLLDFIKTQSEIFKNIKIYLNTYEKGISKLEILRIIRIEYNFNKTIKIWFQDNRPQFDFDLTLNKEQSENLIQFINDTELYKNINKK